MIFIADFDQLYRNVKRFVRLDLKINGAKFWLIAAPPRGEVAWPTLYLFRTESLVLIPNLVSMQKRGAEIWPHFFYGGLVDDFDWLSKGLDNQKTGDVFCEVWSEDDLCQIWWRLDKPYRRGSEKTLYSKWRPHQFSHINLIGCN